MKYIAASMWSFCQFIWGLDPDKVIMSESCDTTPFVLKGTTERKRRGKKLGNKIDENFM